MDGRSPHRGSPSTKMKLPPWDSDCPRKRASEKGKNTRDTKEEHTHTLSFPHSVLYFTTVLCSTQKVVVLCMYFEGGEKKNKINCEHELRMFVVHVEARNIVVHLELARVCLGGY